MPAVVLLRDVENVSQLRLVGLVVLERKGFSAIFCDIASVIVLRSQICPGKASNNSALADVFRYIQELFESHNENASHECEYDRNIYTLLSHLSYRISTEEIRVHVVALMRARKKLASRGEDSRGMP
jgi:hypothetical protein